MEGDWIPEDDWILENDRIEMEDLQQLEEVEDHSSDDNCSENGDDTGFTFNTRLAALHTYLGEVEDTQRRLASFEGGAIVNLPMLYLEGLVLFPEATLPLTVARRSFKAAIETAMNRVDDPLTLGVVHVQRHPGATRVHVATVGTTAEIRKFRREENGSLNVVTRGQQRFRLQRHWIDVEGVPWGKVQIMQEDMPMRTPKDAFGVGQLASVGNLSNNSYSNVVPSESSFVKRKKHDDQENGSECMFDRNTDGSDLSLTKLRMCQPPVDSSDGYRSIHEPVSSSECVSGSGCSLGRSFPDDSKGSQHHCMGDAVSENIAKRDVQGKSAKIWKKTWAADESNWLHRAPRSFWPYWVYRMYDSYSLAQRVTDLWRQLIGSPSLDSLIKKPDLLSFYIASKIPVSESTRQELLAIDGVSYRLRREIQLLERFDLIRCRRCRTVIAKRTDMVVMSSDGPCNAYVNSGGYVHGVVTVSSANGLSLWGSPSKEHSWFPGYAWTIANCGNCGSNIGWLFTATKKKLQPKSFWGIQSIKVADDMPE
ncbi:ATP-dependent protease La domain-containing protein [Cinnamomum micranthum f. kanehirae]|uniref:Protein cereblon n=1 Tax=Cinnamomum micranthum f. kanehirae TaxID=337451 RepID=A0A3S4NK24_9MAGN|nr:ATP-dependent protease La domain-containing protein [Cinnamomum micranthum f. kanehirae]